MNDSLTFPTIRVGLGLRVRTNLLWIRGGVGLKLRSASLDEIIDGVHFLLGSRPELLAKIELEIVRCAYACTGFLALRALRNWEPR